MDTRLGYIGLPLEVHGAEIAQGRVPACRVVEAFDVIEHLGLRLISRAIGFARDPLGLQRGEPKAGVANKLSMAALSQTLPERLIEQVTPLSAISRWNCSLVYWLPWSE